MVCAIPRITPEEWDTQTLLWFWDANGSPNHGQTTRPKKESLLNCGLYCTGRPKRKNETNLKERKVTGPC